MAKINDKLGLIIITFIFTAVLIACGNENQTSMPEKEEAKVLTIYCGRSESLVGPVIEQFSKSTGIETRIKYGGTSELAATILEEGESTPADIFFAQDPAGLGSVEHMLKVIPEEVISGVIPGFKSSENRWVGLSGRARSVVYNTEIHSEEDLPEDIFDYTKPEWKGKIGWAPTNGSFQAMVTAMRVLWGEGKTKEWLTAINNNDAKIYPKNTPIVTAVERGEVEVGFVNHYYLYRFLEEQGTDFNARNYHPASGGPGNLIMVAGVGILGSSNNTELATRFIEFMLSPVSQQFFASQNYEYPVVGGVKTNPMLVDLSDINSPEIRMSDMKDLKGTVELIREVGIIP